MSYSFKSKEEPGFGASGYPPYPHCRITTSSPEKAGSETLKSNLKKKVRSFLGTWTPVQESVTVQCENAFH